MAADNKLMILQEVEKKRAAETGCAQAYEHRVFDVLQVALSLRE